jgi:hypothetical protein
MTAPAQAVADEWPIVASKAIEPGSEMAVEAGSAIPAEPELAYE